MDYVIIGGGIYGCSVAWELAQRGGDALLLEAGEIASGASGGLGERGVRASGRDLRELPLMGLAYERWQWLHEEIQGETGYRRIGGLTLIEQPRDLAAAPAQLWAQNQQSIPTQLLHRDALLALEPRLAPQVSAALFCPQDGVADHTMTTRSMAAAARRAGAVVRESTAVAQVVMGPGKERVVGVITEQGEEIPVGKALILLSNSHVGDFLHSQFGVRLPVWKRLPQVALTHPLAEPPISHLIGHAHRKLAIKVTPDRRVMISGGWAGRWDGETGRGVVQPDQVAGNLAEAVAVFPTLAQETIAQAAADRVETSTVDGIPIIDQLAQAANLFFATGWCGHGWAIAPAVSRLLADWVFDGQRPPLLAPFAYGRFLP